VKKRISKFGAWVFVLLFTVMLLPAVVHAAPLINTNAKGSLTLSFTPAEKPARGVTFNLYQIADITRHGKIVSTAKFSKYQLPFSEMKADEWDEMTLTLQGYIAADKIMPDYFSETDINGQIVFENMPVGVYLVVGDIYHADEHYYLPQAYIVSLPGKGENAVWEYQIESSVKYEVRPEQKPITLEILKVWHEDEVSERPVSIEVEVYENEKLYTTVTLHTDNNWRHILTELKAGAVWTVREKAIPEGYTVMVENQANRIVVNNTRVPEEPETQPEESENQVEEPETPPEEAETPPKTPDSPPETSGETGEKLPQTGVLWWPVPVLAATGLLFIVIGVFLRRGREDEE